MLKIAERYYRILDLEPGASPAEIHQGYIDLIWVWHPDRFAGHPRLQQKAQHKLQQINEAHEWLRSFQETPQQRKLHANKSKTSTSPPSPNQSQAERLYKPKVNQVSVKDTQRTSKDNVQRVRASSRSFDDWLD